MWEFVFYDACEKERWNKNLRQYKEGLVYTYV